MALDVLGQTTFSHLGRGAETRTAVLGFAAATAGAGARGGAGRTAALSCVATEAPGPSGRAESPEEGPPAHREADAQPCPRPLRPHVTRR